MHALWIRLRAAQPSLHSSLLNLACMLLSFLRIRALASRRYLITGRSRALGCVCHSGLALLAMYLMGFGCIPHGRLVAHDHCLLRGPLHLASWTHGMPSTSPAPLATQPPSRTSTLRTSALLPSARHCGPRHVTADISQEFDFSQPLMLHLLVYAPPLDSSRVDAVLGTSRTLPPTATRCTSRSASSSTLGPSSLLRLYLAHSADIYNCELPHEARAPLATRRSPCSPASARLATRLPSPACALLEFKFPSSVHAA